MEEPLKNLAGDICINLEITRNCNMSCPYCYLTNEPSLKRRPELTEAQWYRIAQLIEREFEGRTIRFHLAGGEVFTKEWVPDFIEWVLKKGIVLTVVSNGLTLPDAIFTRPIFKGKRFAISISIDGLKKENAYTRIHFDTVIANFKKLAHCGVDLGVKTTVHKNSLKGMLEFHKYINDIGKNFCRVIAVEPQPVISFFRRPVEKFRNLQLNLHEYIKEGLRVAHYAKRHLKNIICNWRFISEIWELGRMPEGVSFDSAWFGCASGYGFTVTANGGISPCEMARPAYNLLGRLDAKNLKVAMDNIEKDYSPRKRCMGCRYRSVCGMCRYGIVHGYVGGFGYGDCRKLYDDIIGIYGSSGWKYAKTGNEKYLV